ncbi:MAG: hypothetical protein WEF86_00995 [Gemmatimonadota bacterium]
MKGNRFFLVAIMLLAAPLPLFAQGGGAGGGRGGMMSSRALLEQGSVEYLVTHAAHLQLSAEQTSGLQTIGAAWSAATKESREQVSASMPARAQGEAAAGNREAMMQRMQELRPVLQKLTEDDQKALDEALALLSDPQKAEARKLLEERAAAMRPRRGGN